MAFFLEFSYALVLAMTLLGFFLGVLLGFLFWGIYRGRTHRQQLEVEHINASLKNLRATNKSLKSQLSGRS